jgi:hypothetical protein
MVEAIGVGPNDVIAVTLIEPDLLQSIAKWKASVVFTEEDERAELLDLVTLEELGQIRKAVKSRAGKITEEDAIESFLRCGRDFGKLEVNLELFERTQ